MPSRNARFGGCVIVAILIFAAVVALAVGGFGWFASRWQPAPVPGQQRCVATVQDTSTKITLEQAHYASIIAGVSVKRDLPPRAASIALATAYQESGIRNLDYGDRDSVGLFQQRPSQGWGSEQQLMDPHYASGKFYDALVKIRNWQSGEGRRASSARIRGAASCRCSGSTAAHRRRRAWGSRPARCFPFAAGS